MSEKHENDSALYRATGKLIVKNLKRKKDAGFYKCIVEDDTHGRNAFQLKIKQIIGIKYTERFTVV